MSLRVLDPGFLTLVEDLGRPGLASLGVGGSGAADRGALRLANRLVGNDEGAAGLEVVLGGLRLQAATDVTLAVTGAPAPLTVDGRPVGQAAVLRLAPGQVLALGTPDHGLRSYVTVRGGVAVPAVLGSRAYDVLSQLGPPPLRAGDELPIGRPQGLLPDTDQAPVRARGSELPLLPGPRTDWLQGGLPALAGTWTVSSASDRIGVRLVGPVLARSDARELPSEGLLPGAVQLPPDGQPVLFLADAPVTGGYPVVAVVPSYALDLAAQLRPGQQVRLVTSVIRDR